MMISFLESLWSSIFTPGTTPALLLATNVSFLLLQVTLTILYFLTYSIHFIVLNVICVGLWVSINWFVREVEAFQREKEMEEQEEKVDEDGDKNGSVEEKEESKKEI